MYPVVLAIGVVILALVDAWAIIRANRLLVRGQREEAIGYLVAFVVLMFFAVYLGIHLPLG